MSISATALVCSQQQEFTLEPVQLPDPGAGQVAMRTAWSGVSIGTEFALIRNKLSWGPYPLVTGYMATGTITAIGPEVADYAVGDMVYARGNSAGITLADGTAATAVSGTHCSHLVSAVGGTHGVDHLPAGVPVDVASAFVMPAVGLLGVEMAQPKVGQVVVVYGAGLIGLAVVAACVHRGCRVIAVDLVDHRLEVAREFGAVATVNAGAEDVAAAVHAWAPAGADVVFESTGIPKCLAPAMELCRVDGSFVWQGNYGAAAFPFEFLRPHGRRLRMFFPCDDGYQPFRRAVMRNLATGALAWEKTITHRVTAAEAPALFTRINAGADDVLGALVDWRQA